MKPRLFDGEHTWETSAAVMSVVAAMKPRLFDGEHADSSAISATPLTPQ